MRHRTFANIVVVALASLSTGCALGPDYERPGAPVPTTYKEVKGWKIAAPSDDIDRGAWWWVYHDQTLDALEGQVEVSNQTLAAAEADRRRRSCNRRAPRCFPRSACFTTLCWDGQGYHDHARHARDNGDLGRRCLGQGPAPG